jgi:hypothetical protein
VDRLRLLARQDPDGLAQVQLVPLAVGQQHPVAERTRQRIHHQLAARG